MPGPQRVCSFCSKDGARRVKYYVSAQEFMRVFVCVPCWGNLDMIRQNGLTILS